MNLVLNKDNGIEITSVDEYMKEIGVLNSEKNNPNAQLFFRGQAVDYWNISSTIVRDEKLGIEHHLMSEPLRQIPNEFVNIGAGFEIMEKYQHYGMCTRLLDVTTNPLVALYFACEHHKEEEYRDSVSKEILKMSPIGIVYFKEENAPLKYDDLEVRIISKLASYDLNGSRTLGEVIHKLYEDKIISGEQLKTWSNDKGLLEFINICQNVFTVLPIMNNDRLIRQSGAFLLPGQFNMPELNEKPSIYLEDREASWKTFINDIKSAKKKIHIDMPDVMEDFDIKINQLCEIFNDEYEKGVEICIRHSAEIDLPNDLQKYQKIFEYVTTPVTIIDKSIIWFGQPLYAADFISEGSILDTEYFPCVRFKGKYSARLLQAFLEM